MQPLSSQGGRATTKRISAQLPNKNFAKKNTILQICRAEKAKKYHEKLGTVLEEARELDLYYIASRYPNELPGGYPYWFYSKDSALNPYFYSNMKE